MHKRDRNLIILIALMMIPVICLCACMTQDKPEETENVTPSTTDSGYGIVDFEENTAPQDDEITVTQPEDDGEATEATTATKPAQSAGAEQKPSAGYKPGSVSYEDFLKLSSDEQQAYADSFSTISDYITWFNSEKAKYDNSQAIEITGPIDLGDLVGKNNG